METTTKVSLDTIAKLTGVSKTTVSLVLNGRASQYRINESTAKRILNVAKKNGFSPNSSARSLRTGTSKTLGLVISDISNPFSSELAKDIEEYASLKGFRLFIVNTNDDPEKEEIVIKGLIDRNIDGFIISTIRMDIPPEIRTPRKIIPVVYIDRSRSTADCLFVTSDNRQGMHDCTLECIKRGAHNIAYVGGIAHLSTHRDRLDGFRDALRINKLAFNKELYSDGGFTSESGFTSMNKILDRNTPFDSLICASYTLFEGAIKALKQRVPELLHSITLATFDDHPMLDILPYNIISVKQNCKKISEMAIQLLTDAIDKKVITETTMVPCHCIVR